MAWTIVVTNDGNVTLTNVRVTDPQAPDCAKTSANIAALASMAPGASVTYTCNRANVTASFTNVATDIGTPPTGADVTATDSAHVTVTVPLTPPTPAPKPVVKVTNPAITIVKSPNSQTVAMGGAATFVIKVTNNGDVTLKDVTVTDKMAPNCNRDLGTMAPGRVAHLHLLAPEHARELHQRRGRRRHPADRRERHRQRLGASSRPRR